MILTRRVVPFIAPLFVACFFVGLFLQPQEWQSWVLSILIFSFITIGFMTDWTFRSAEFWNLLFPLFAISMGASGLLFFMSSQINQIVVCAAVVIIWGMYLEDVFTFRYQPQKYTSLSLPNLSTFMNTFAAFAIFTTGYALHFINRLPVWVLPIIGFALAFAFMGNLFWGYKIGYRNNVGVMLLFAILVSEFVWVVHFWPTSYFVNGIIVGIVLYCLPSLIQLHVRNILTRRLLVQYIVVSVVTALAVVTTAQWT